MSKRRATQGIHLLDEVQRPPSKRRRNAASSSCPFLSLSIDVIGRIIQDLAIEDGKSGCYTTVVVYNVMLSFLLFLFFFHHFSLSPSHEFTHRYGILNLILFDFECQWVALILPSVTTHSGLYGSEHYPCK